MNKAIVIKCLLTLSLTVGNLLSAHGQQLQAALSHYSTDDGLCSNAVSDIKQDGYGYIWIATWNGLSRFDGFNFYNYKTGGQSRVPLLHNRISDIEIDRMQNVWMRMYDGRVFVLERRTDRIVNPFTDVSGYKDFRSTSKLSVTHNGDILILMDGVGIYRMKSTLNGISKQLITTERLKATSIVEGYKDDLWVGTDKGIHQFNSSSETIDGIGILEEESIMCMYSNGYNIYAGTTSGKIVEWSYGEEPRLLLQLQEPVRTLFKDSRGSVWFATDKQGISRLDLTNGTTKDYEQTVTVPEYDQHTAKVTEVSGVIWVNMNHGGFGYFNREKDEIEYFHNNPMNPWELSNTLASFLALPEGVIFEATSRKGLEKLEILKKTINRLPIYEGAQGQNTNEVRAIFYDKERRLLFAGNKKGLLKITDGVHMNYYNDVGGTGDFGRIYGISKDRKGNYWISTKGTGIIKMTPAGGGYRYARYRMEKGRQIWLNDENIYATVEDPYGNIWIATYGGGVNVLTKDKNGTEIIANCDNIMRHYPKNEYRKVRTLAMDKRGRVWAGTTDGVLIMEKRGNHIKMTRVENSEEVEANLNSKDIIELKCDAKGTMWIGTNGGGLSRCINTNAYNGFKFETFGISDGLPSEEIKSITFDAAGNVWFATDHMLCSFDTKRHIFSTFGIQDGVDDCICSEGAAATTARDNLVFGTQDGYYFVDKNKLTGGKGLALKLQITDFFLNDELISPRLNNLLDYYVPETKEVTLPDHNSLFSFRFASLNYQLQHRVHYQYYLEGYDKQWHTADKERTASYSNLPSGKYILRIKASLLESPDKIDMKSITVIVPPSFLLSSSAIWIYMVVFILLTVGLLIWRQNKMMDMMERKRKAEGEEATKAESSDEKKEEEIVAQEEDIPETEIIEDAVIMDDDNISANKF